MCSQHPTKSSSKRAVGSVREALEIQQLYQHLETSLAKPGRVLDVGDAYRQSLGVGKGWEILGATSLLIRK
jgi:hypothetical protein